MPGTSLSSTSIQVRYKSLRPLFFEPWWPHSLTSIWRGHSYVTSSFSKLQSILIVDAAAAVVVVVVVVVVVMVVPVFFPHQLFRQNHCVLLTGRYEAQSSELKCRTVRIGVAAVAWQMDFSSRNDEKKHKKTKQTNKQKKNTRALEQFLILRVCKEKKEKKRKHKQLFRNN